MKRFDLKMERALRDMDKEKLRLRVVLETIETQYNDRLKMIEQDISLIRDFQYSLENDLKLQNAKTDFLVPLRNF
jgi:hypothetical protein